MHTRVRLCLRAVAGQGRRGLDSEDCLAQLVQPDGHVDEEPHGARVAHLEEDDVARAGPEQDEPDEEGHHVARALEDHGGLAYEHGDGGACGELDDDVGGDEMGHTQKQSDRRVLRHFLLRHGDGRAELVRTVG